MHSGECLLLHGIIFLGQTWSTRTYLWILTCLFSKTFCYNTQPDTNLHCVLPISPCCVLDNPLGAVFESNSDNEHLEMAQCSFTDLLDKILLNCPCSDHIFVNAIGLFAL